MKNTRSSRECSVDCRMGLRTGRFAFLAVLAVAAFAIGLAMYADDWDPDTEADADGEANTFWPCGDGVYYEYKVRTPVRPLTIIRNGGTGMMVDYGMTVPPWLDAIRERTILEVTIGSGVVGIGSSAFNRYYSYDDIMILSNLAGVEKVGGWAFRGCIFVERPDLSDVKEIGELAFAESKGIEHLDLSSVEKIGKKAFAACAGITTIIFGENLKEIAPSAFGGMTFYENETTELELSAENMRGRTFTMVDGKMVMQTLQILVFDYGYGDPVVRIYHNGDAIVKPADPKKDGYTFKYWTEDRKTEFTDTTMPGRSLILTPYWTVNQYPVIIGDPSHLTVMDDGTEVENLEKVDYGTLLTVEAKEAAGYTSKIFLNGTEITEGCFRVGLVNVLDVEYEINPVVIDDDDDDPGYQPIPSAESSSSSISEKAVVTAAAAAAAFAVFLGALVAFRF